MGEAPFLASIHAIIDVVCSIGLSIFALQTLASVYTCGQSAKSSIFHYLLMKLWRKSYYQAARIFRSLLFNIFNAKKAIFTLVSGRDGFLYHHRILLLQWNLLDTTLVTTALEGS